jgi:hypothetical protein
MEIAGTANRRKRTCITKRNSLHSRIVAEQLLHIRCHLDDSLVAEVNRVTLIGSVDTMLALSGLTG